jgi:hypothetical protein
MEFLIYGFCVAWWWLFEPKPVAHISIKKQVLVMNVWLIRKNMFMDINSAFCIVNTTLMLTTKRNTMSIFNPLSSLKIFSTWRRV